MKICKQCNTEKPVTDFYKAAGTKDGKKSLCKDCDSIQRRSDRYNLPFEQIVALFASGCNICGGTEKLTIDHDHRCCSGKESCGKCIRGALCMKCNQGVGYLNHDPNLLRLAIRYLEN